MVIRNLVFGDCIPEELEIGFVAKDLTPDLVWVAVDGPKVVGILIAFAAHGWFFPFRLCVSKTAPRGCVLQLLRKSFRQAMARGYTFYYAVFMNESFESKAARQLLRILESRGETATLEGDSVWIGGMMADLFGAGRLPRKLEASSWVA